MYSDDDVMNALVEQIESHSDDDGIWRDPNTETWWRLGEFGVPVTVTRPGDPARLLMMDGFTSTTDAPVRKECYICNDPEFSQMGLPLCRKCPACGGHIAADDSVCDACGLDDSAFHSCPTVDELVRCFSTGYPEYDVKVPSDTELGRAVNAWLLKKEGKHERET